METCIRFADENAAQQPVTSMLVNSPPPAKDKPSGGGHGKPGGKPGGQAGKPGVSALATTNGTSTGLCLHHCLKGSCFKKSAFCQAHQEDAHPPARAGHGILPSELAAWPSCGKPDCTYGLQCIFKHGDGTEQVAAKHGRLSTSRTHHATATSAAPPCLCFPFFFLAMLSYSPLSLSVNVVVIRLRGVHTLFIPLSRSDELLRHTIKTSVKNKIFSFSLN